MTDEENPVRDNLLIKDVRYAQQREPGIQTQPEHHVAQKFVTLDSRCTSDGYQRNLYELHYEKI
jgi:hypothetical protein